ncbi:MAG: hypothetical protein EAZ33_06615, partial [Oscillatoriales cyanobacterium]
MFHRAIGLRHSSTFATFSVDSEGAIGKIALGGPQAREFDVILTGQLKKTDLNAVQLKYWFQHKLALTAHQPGFYPKSEAGKFAYLGRNRVFRQESRRPTVDRAFVPDAIEQQPIANCQGQPQLISLPSKRAQTQLRAIGCCFWVRNCNLIYGQSYPS